MRMDRQLLLPREHYPTAHNPVSMEEKLKEMQRAQIQRRQEREKILLADPTMQTKLHEMKQQYGIDPTQRKEQRGLPASMPQSQLNQQHVPAGRQLRQPVAELAAVPGQNQPKQQQPQTMLARQSPQDSFVPLQANNRAISSRASPPLAILSNPSQVRMMTNATAPGAAAADVPSPCNPSTLHRLNEAIKLSGAPAAKASPSPAEGLPQHTQIVMPVGGPFPRLSPDRTSVGAMMQNHTQMSAMQSMPLVSSAGLQILQPTAEHIKMMDAFSQPPPPPHKGRFPAPTILGQQHMLAGGPLMDQAARLQALEDQQQQLFMAQQQQQASVIQQQASVIKQQQLAIQEQQVVLAQQQATMAQQQLRKAQTTDAPSSTSPTPDATPAVTAIVGMPSTPGGASLVPPTAKVSGAANSLHDLMKIPPFNPKIRGVSVSSTSSSQPAAEPHQPSPPPHPVTPHQQMFIVGKQQQSQDLATVSSHEPQHKPHEKQQKQKSADEQEPLKKKCADASAPSPKAGAAKPMPKRPPTLGPQEYSPKRAASAASGTDKKAPRKSKSSSSPRQRQQDTSTTSAASNEDDKKKDKKNRRKNTQWMTSYEQLEAYKKQFGHCRVPRGYPPNPTLGSWVAEQRKQYRRLELGRSSTLLPERIELLEALDFSWHAQQAAWASHYDKLVQFSKEMGHCHVSLTADPAYTKLGLWVKEQRRHYTLMKSGKTTHMTAHRVAALEKIGFCWDTHQATWLGRFCELQAFQQRHGHANVPLHWTDNPGLAQWVQQQRRQYERRQKQLAAAGGAACLAAADANSEGDASKRITQERIEKLTELGFEWDVAYSDEGMVMMAATTTEDAATPRPRASSLSSNDGGSRSGRKRPRSGESPVCSDDDETAAAAEEPVVLLRKRPLRVAAAAAAEPTHSVEDNDDDEAEEEDVSTTSASSGYHSGRSSEKSDDDEEAEPRPKKRILVERIPAVAAATPPPPPRKKKRRIPVFG